MAAKITRDVLESYLKCRYKGHLKLAGEKGRQADYEVLLREARDRLRPAATAWLLARYEEAVVLRGIDVTPALLKRGVPLLLDATVESEELSVCFDGLQRKSGPSMLGD